MKRKISVFILLSLFCSSLMSLTLKDSSKMEDLNFRVKKIEEYRSIDDNKFENKSKELDLKLEEYRQQKSILDIIALTVGSFAIFSLIGLWLQARKLAYKKIEEKFETLLNDKKQLLVNIIETHDKEAELKKKKIIYIIASADSNTDFLIKFFRKLDFFKLEIKKVSQYEKLDINVKYDILFLFREEGNKPLEDELCRSYITESRNDSVVFIFGKYFDLSCLNGKVRCSSATFWSQLYGNLLSALKYQELID